MKKTMAMLLALLLVAVMLPVMAMAEDVYTALPVADSNGVISLDKDVVLSTTAKITSNVTIEFNGRTIRNGDGLGNSYILDVQATVTMKGGTIADSRTNDSGTITTIRNLGTLNLENMTISRGAGIAVKNDEAGVGNGGVLNVTNCTISVTGEKAQAIQNWGTATINSGTFTGQVNAWASPGWNPGKTIINGGTFNGDVYSLQYNRIEGNTPSGWPNVAAETIITGGTFNGTVITSYQQGGQHTVTAPEPENPTPGKIDVSGGTFNTDVRPYVHNELVVTYGNNYYVGDDAAEIIESAQSGTITVENVGNNTSFTVKPGVTVQNNWRGDNITVNGKNVYPGEIYTVPGAPIIIYTPTEDTPKANDQKNPSTGANDFVGVAAALAVVSLLGAAVAVRKK